MVRVKREGIVRGVVRVERGHSEGCGEDGERGHGEGIVRGMVRVERGVW